MPHQIAPSTTTLLLRIAITLTALLGVVGASVAGAQESPVVAWSQTSLTGTVRKLYTPASGALFARTNTGLARSDDAGSTWSPVALPTSTPLQGTPGWTRAILVDPTNHQTIYAVMKDGIYKTEDDAATWRLMLPNNPDVPDFRIMAVSPVDNRLVYVALSHARRNHLRLVRSADGGETWETVLHREISQHVSCDWGVALLQAHATDPNRVYLAASCVRNGRQATLEESTDRGTTWRDLYRPTLAEPDWLVTAPSLYLALRKDERGGGSILTRSQDDGASWTTLLEHSGGGGMSGGGPDVWVGGLASDPTNPDRLLLGLNASQGEHTLPSRLRLSEDGGATWTDVAAPDLPRLHDVRFGADGQLLFVATDTGVWRAPAQ
jgi:photosystem II stability/assembly factor-like uncharacterized protein